MPGTRAGGLKTTATVKAKYGQDFYVIAGAKGGRASKKGGFYANRELARTAGSKGGTARWKAEKAKQWSK